MTRGRDSSETEPFIRVVGRRTPPPAGRPPSPEARAAMGALAHYRTRAPKGVFIYPSHEAANADRLRWLLDAMAARR